MPTWPDSVVIAEWFSKPRQYGQDEEQTKRGRLDEVVDSVNEAAAAAAAAVAQPASANDVHQVSVSIASDVVLLWVMILLVVVIMIMMSNPI